MFGGGFRGQKLKTNLRLCINRLKLMEKKKTEQAQKARKEIADYISMGKDERARIRVEHIIREDYLVEAMELIEMYCDLLLARFGLIETMKTVDDGLHEAIATIIWVSPRMSTDIQELRVVAEQLMCKYGKEFFQLCISNMDDRVNSRLMHKMSPAAPSQTLVENYMIEIAKNYNVHYVPNPMAFNGGDIEELLINMDDNKPPTLPPGGGGSGGGGFTAGPLPSVPAPQPQAPPPQAPQAAPYPPALNPGMAYPPPLNAPQGAVGGYPQAPSVVPTPATPAPPYELHDSNPTPFPPAASNAPNQPSAPAQTPPKPPGALPTDTIPNLPAVPMSSFPPLDASVGGKSAGGEDVDFDDLTRRFEELKKKK